MTTKQQTKPETVPTPATTPFSHQPYGTSTLIRLRRLLSHASDREEKFFNEILDEWERGTFDLLETAFRKSVGSMGYTWLAQEMENEGEHKEDLSTFYQVLYLRDQPWLADFLKEVLFFYKDGAWGTWNPEKMLTLLEIEMDEFHTALDTARELLRDHPQDLVAELRKAVEDHPELIASQQSNLAMPPANREKRTQAHASRECQNERPFQEGRARSVKLP